MKNTAKSILLGSFLIATATTAGCDRPDDLIGNGGSGTSGYLPEDASSSNDEGANSAGHSGTSGSEGANSAGWSGGASGSSEGDVSTSTSGSDSDGSGSSGSDTESDESTGSAESTGEENDPFADFKYCVWNGVNEDYDMNLNGDYEEPSNENSQLSHLSFGNDIGTKYAFVDAYFGGALCGTFDDAAADMNDDAVASAAVMQIFADCKHDHITPICL